jgi:hypothetical protein
MRMVPGPFNWTPNFASTSGLMKSGNLSVVIHFGSIPECHAELLDQLMRTYNDDLTKTPTYGESQVSCQTWVLAVVRLLVGHGLVKCEDVGKLERECKDLGNEATREGRDVRPRPVVVATTCS